MNGKKVDAVVVGNVGIETKIYEPGSAIDFNLKANFTANIDYVGQAGGYASRSCAQLDYATALANHRPPCLHKKGFIGNGNHIGSA